MPPRLRLAIGLAALALAGACAGPKAAGLLGPALPDPRAPLDDAARRWVEETQASLTLREKVGQLVIPWIPGGYASVESAEFDTLSRWVGEEGIGGVAISIGPPLAFAAKLNALQRRARVPLLVTSDFEHSGPGTRLAGIYSLPHVLNLGGGTMLPPTMAFGAIGDERFAYEFGRITGAEARAVGVHVNFAPVLDVNSNPDNPIINTRSFGEDPEQVASLGAAYIRGAHAAGLLVTGKHFPGHGDTREDSHIELPAVPFTRERMDTLELVPFRRAIAEGMDLVMTAHIAATEILGPDAPPATVSPFFLTELLRTELGFDGVITTDAMDMGGIVTRYGSAASASVLAIEAGADIILFPVDVSGTIDTLTAAVRDGRITEARLDASVRRVLELKARSGLHRGRFVNLEAVEEIVGRRGHVAFADTAAMRSITLPRDRDGIVPLDTARFRRAFAVAFTLREDLAAARVFHRRLAPAFERLDTARVDYATRTEAYDSLAAVADSADLVVLSVSITPRAWAGTVATSEAFVEFGNRLIATGKPVVLVSFGNPYLLRDLADVGTYLLAWGGREVSQEAAARALLGEAPITGRLPISLPPFHRAGEGLQRPRPMASPDSR